MITRIWIYAFLLLAATAVKGQSPSCPLVVRGQVISADSAALPPGAVSINLPKLNRGVRADSSGTFSIDHICNGRLELVISCEGFRTLDTVVRVNKDITLQVSLHTVADQLHTVEVTGRMLKKDQLSTAVTTTISGAALEQTKGLSLGEALKTISGVNTLQTGPTIFKPVIHGVYSNRILILNNGIRQEGQNWGNDHAPEIDPFIATRITVIKGPASIRYGSDAIGGVILVEPKELPAEPGFGGGVDVVGMTNGRGGAVSGNVEGAAGGKWKGLSFRLQGSLKKAGNAEAANYWLGNTGYNEGDYSATLRYAKDRYGIEAYYSRFVTKIGIATASHIGTVQDLLSAIARPEPAVKADFTYSIVRPYQTIDHQLLKADAYWKLGKFGRLDYVFARQVDTRKEYDADISFNDSLAKLNPPDLYFRLTTYTNDLVWQHPAIGKKIVGSFGLNYLTHGNLQQGTGYQELIPNFVDYGGGAFLIEKAEWKKLTVEAGLRYDYRWMRAYTVDARTLREDRPTYTWNRTTFNAGAVYYFNDHFSVDYNFGTAWRPPQVIELFANGIHQSAVDYEHGDSTLTLETAYNNTLSFNWLIGPLHIEAGGYINYFHHYIYLRPDAPKVQSTIQGAFPSFTYTQTNALFQGVDLTVEYSFLKHFLLTSKTSIVRARDVSTDDWLIGIPSDKFDNTLKYEWPMVGKKVKALFISVNNLAVPRQVRVPTKIQDYAPPPDGYILWGAAAGCSIPVGKKWMDVSLTATNLTNVAYRDYMDKFRYFIDEIGRNVILRVSVPF
ncbi:MAG TPA: TonB-dependent receptor [Puia sp.]|uniref:TonB-dependent receptor n=1 Tax=Puia sp. TaxID=2045100 RepID=UPI002BA13D39|nr:TonB-dependent receptor [Puia sp.]HVU94685.1 TonB-dependent receptor [Puia sp.]